MFFQMVAWGLSVGSTFYNATDLARLLGGAEEGVVGFGLGRIQPLCASVKLRSGFKMSPGYYIFFGRLLTWEHICTHLLWEESVRINSLTTQVLQWAF